MFVHNRCCVLSHTYHALPRIIIWEHFQYVCLSLFPPHISLSLCGCVISASCANRIVLSFHSTIHIHLFIRIPFSCHSLSLAHFILLFQLLSFRMFLKLFPSFFCSSLFAFICNITVRVFLFVHSLCLLLCVCVGFLYTFAFNFILFCSFTAAAFFLLLCTQLDIAHKNH